MKIISPSFEFESFDSQEILQNLEKAGRTCYKSEEKITDTSCIPFIKNVITRGHESVLEHEKLTCRVVCDRGISHECVRHRIASYSQESSRYVNYSNFDEISFIDIRKAFNYNDDSPQFNLWRVAMINAEYSYLEMIKAGCSPQEARSVLPNSVKTEIVITMNLRAWRHFFRLRALGTAGKPHPQMLELTIPMLEYCKQNLPVIFADL